MRVNIAATSNSFTKKFEKNFTNNSWYSGPKEMMASANGIIIEVNDRITPVILWDIDNTDVSCGL